LFELENLTIRAMCGQTPNIALQYQPIDFPVSFAHCGRPVDQTAHEMSLKSLEKYLKPATDRPTAMLGKRQGPTGTWMTTWQGLLSRRQFRPSSPLFRMTHPPRCWTTGLEIIPFACRLHRLQVEALPCAATVMQAEEQQRQNGIVDTVGVDFHAHLATPSRQDHTTGNRPV